MQSLSNLNGSELRWIRPRRLRPDSELRAGDTLIATLTWARGSRASARWGATQYGFNRQGWFRPRILVHDERPEIATAPDAPVATFARDALTCADSHVYRWKKPKRWTNERMWVDAASIELVRFSPGKKSTNIVLVAPSSATPADLPLLILLGQYLLVLAAQDAEVASIAATTVVVSS